MILTRYEVHAYPPIQWLMECEPDVVDAVRAFALGKGPSRFSVMIPESPLKRALDKAMGRKLTMLSVELWLTVGRNNLTGVSKIMVAASDRDMKLISDAGLVPPSPLPANVARKVKEAFANG